MKDKRPFFAGRDAELNGTEKVEFNNAQMGTNYTAIFNYTTGSPFNQYILFKYDCVYRSHFCTEEVHHWKESVPYEKDYDWNYNVTTQKANETNLDLFSFYCGENQKQNASKIENITSNICKKFFNVDFGVSMTCKDCYFHTPVKMHGFELVINHFRVHKAQFYASAEYNVKLNLRIPSRF